MTICLINFYSNIKFSIGTSVWHSNFIENITSSKKPKKPTCCRPPNQHRWLREGATPLFEESWRRLPLNPTSGSPREPPPLKFRSSRELSHTNDPLLPPTPRKAAPTFHHYTHDRGRRPRKSTPTIKGRK